jgi:Leucine-rich repeat (LRR) protein
MLDNLQSLSIKRIGAVDLADLRYFPRLTQLSLTDGVFSSVDMLPELPELKELDLSNNNLSDIHSLWRLRNLESLNISGNENIKSFATLLSLKKLRFLKIGNITHDGFETLQRTFPAVKIDAVILN